MINLAYETMSAICELLALGCESIAIGGTNSIVNGFLRDVVLDTAQTISRTFEGPGGRPESVLAHKNALSPASCHMPHLRRWKSQSDHEPICIARAAGIQERTRKPAYTYRSMLLVFVLHIRRMS